MEMTMETVITNVGSVLTGVIGWTGDVATMIAGNPLMLVFTILPLVGIGIGVFKRVTR